MRKISILGIKLSQINHDNVLGKIEEFLASKKTNFIVTPNPEIVLEALEDEELFYIINSADLALPDGFGLKLAAFLEGENICRITGADLVNDILAMAQEKKIKVGIYNWKDGLSSKRDIETAIKKKYPDLEVFCQNANRNETEFTKDMQEFDPKIILVNYGAPYQEKFIFKALTDKNNVRLALGIGGAIDFITGRAIRAPKWLRYIGMEWFWRLLHSPKRIKRIYRAVVEFSFKIIRHKFVRPFFYRPNVSCLLYKREGEKHEILVVERMDEKGEWQLPQGGRDGQNLMDAGSRELREEINCDSFIPKRAYKNVYKYKFGGRKHENSCRADSRRKHTGFKGQKQGLFIAEFTGKDEDIKVNFWDHRAWKWVDSEKLIDSVHVIRKRATQRFMHKFEEFIKTSK